MRLSTNTILITGGGSGIGLALAVALAEHDNTVIICGRDKRKLHDACLEHPNITAIPCDLNNKVEIQSLVTTIQDKFPSLNMLVNNAGIQLNGIRFDELPFEDIEKEIAVNLTAPLFLIYLLLPILARQKSSAIVNVTSSLAITPKTNALSYCASKAAMHSATYSLRQELTQTPIRVVEVMPGLVDTAMTQGRGQHKMPPGDMAQGIIDGLKSDKDNIVCKQALALSYLQRLSPKLANRMVNK